MTQHVIPKSILAEKNQNFLDNPKFQPIKNKDKREVIAQIIENQLNEFERGDSREFIDYTNARINNQRAELRQAGVLNETIGINDAPINGDGNLSTGNTGQNTRGNVAGFDSVLMGILRRALPMNIGFEVCAVQPMNAPTSSIFALKSRWNTPNGSEALFRTPDTLKSGNGTAVGAAASGVFSGLLTGLSVGKDTATGEGAPTNSMAISLEKVNVIATTRSLSTSYSTELQQDLAAVHGLDTDTIMGEMLANEIMWDINREIVDSIKITSKVGCSVNHETTTDGVFDLAADGAARWQVEQFKGLMFQLEKESNYIAKESRRGVGNIVICSPNVASALRMAGVLDYSSALASLSNMHVDDTLTTFAGILNGKFKVFLDPYSSVDYAIVGYKGEGFGDAGMFYCPYIPLQIYRAQNPTQFQPLLAFKTRYGLVNNPFVTLDATANGNVQGVVPSGQADVNYFYRKFVLLNV